MSSTDQAPSCDNGDDIDVSIQTSRSLRSDAPTRDGVQVTDTQVDLTFGAGIRESRGEGTRRVISYPTLGPIARAHTGSPSDSQFTVLGSEPGYYSNKATPTKWGTRATMERIPGRDTIVGICHALSLDLMQCWLRLGVSYGILSPDQLMSTSPTPADTLWLPAGWTTLTDQRRALWRETGAILIDAERQATGAAAKDAEIKELRRRIDELGRNNETCRSS